MHVVMLFSSVVVINPPVFRLLLLNLFLDLRNFLNQRYHGLGFGLQGQSVGVNSLLAQQHGSFELAVLSLDVHDLIGQLECFELPVVVKLVSQLDDKFTLQVKLAILLSEGRQQAAQTGLSFLLFLIAGPSGGHF